MLIYAKIFSQGEYLIESTFFLARDKILETSQFSLFVTTDSFRAHTEWAICDLRAIYGLFAMVIS